MKQLTILGATGSIGRSTLDIVAQFPDRFQVAALTAKTNIRLLARQIETFKPRMAVVVDAQHARELEAQLSHPKRTAIHHGVTGYRAAAALDGVDMVVSAMVGAAGLIPTLAAIDAGRPIALANKETLVMAGEVMIRQAAARNVPILPVDSEHSAIFQCLEGHRRQDLLKILLTASGGPFRNTPQDKFGDIQPADALKHPNWDMGAKITIDSATLMNKGLEVIEAHWLFGVPVEQIEVVVHPQSLIHSMVAYCDGSLIAQLGIPDMKGAIAYALSYPARLPLGQPLPQFTHDGPMTFQTPDVSRFPCLSLAIAACRAGQTYPAALNAANEVAVQAFLAHQLPFLGIPQVIEAVVERHQAIADATLEEILQVDRASRKQAQAMLRKHQT